MFKKFSTLTILLSLFLFFYSCAGNSTNTEINIQMPGSPARAVYIASDAVSYKVSVTSADGESISRNANAGELVTISEIKGNKNYTVVVSAYSKDGVLLAEGEQTTFVPVNQSTDISIKLEFKVNHATKVPLFLENPFDENGNKKYILGNKDIAKLKASFYALPGNTYYYKWIITDHPLESGSENTSNITDEDLESYKTVTSDKVLYEINDELVVETAEAYAMLKVYYKKDSAYNCVSANAVALDVYKLESFTASYNYAEGKDYEVFGSLGLDKFTISETYKNAAGTEFVNANADISKYEISSTVEQLSETYGDIPFTVTNSVNKELKQNVVVKVCYQYPEYEITLGWEKVEGKLCITPHVTLKSEYQYPEYLYCDLQELRDKYETLPAVGQVIKMDEYFGGTGCFEGLSRFALNSDYLSYGGNYFTPAVTSPVSVDSLESGNVGVYEYTIELVDSVNCMLAYSEGYENLTYGVGKTEYSAKLDLNEEFPIKYVTTSSNGNALIFHEKDEIKPFGENGESTFLVENVLDYDIDEWGNVFVLYDSTPSNSNENKVYVVDKYSRVTSYATVQNIVSSIPGFDHYGDFPYKMAVDSETGFVWWVKLEDSKIPSAFYRDNKATNTTDEFAISWENRNLTDFLVNGSEIIAYYKQESSSNSSIVYTGSIEYMMNQEEVTMSLNELVNDKLGSLVEGNTYYINDLVSANGKYYLSVGYSRYYSSGDDRYANSRGGIVEVDLSSPTTVSNCFGLVTDSYATTYIESEVEKSFMTKGPTSDNDDKYFYGPKRIVARKPDTLFIADMGFYCVEDDLYDKSTVSAKAAARVVNFSIKSENGDYKINEVFDSHESINGEIDYDYSASQFITKYF